MLCDVLVKWVEREVSKGRESNNNSNSNNSNSMKDDNNLMQDMK